MSCQAPPRRHGVGTSGLLPSCMRVLRAPTYKPAVISPSSAADGTTSSSPAGTRWPSCLRRTTRRASQRTPWAPPTSVRACGVGSCEALQACPCSRGVAWWRCMGRQVCATACCHGMLPRFPATPALCRAAALLVHLLLDRLFPFPFWFSADRNYYQCWIGLKSHFDPAWTPEKATAAPAGSKAAAGGGGEGGEQAAAAQQNGAAPAATASGAAS